MTRTWLNGAGAFVAGLLVAIAAPGVRAVPPPSADAPAEAAVEAATPYTVDITVVGDQALLDPMRRSSNLIALIGSPPSSVAGLERRIEADRQRLDAVMRSEGYYDATLAVDIGSGQPAAVAIVATAGRRYVIDRVTVEGLSEGGGDVTTDQARSAAALAALVPARAADVVGAEARIIDLLKEKGHAFAKMGTRRVVVDHDRHTMDVAYVVEPGPVAKMGLATVSGAPGVGRELVLNRLPWKRGDRYQPALMLDARRDIAALGVFDTVLVALDPQHDLDGETPVNVTLSERKRHFIGTSAVYSTSDGFGLKAWWGHRNLLGDAERLRVDLSVARLGTQTVSSGGLSDTDFRLGAIFDVPDFLTTRQDLHVGLTFLTENPAAYERDAEVLEARVTRRFTGGWTVSAGLEQETATVLTNDDSWHVVLLGAPVSVGIDTTERPLDPRQGFRANLAVAPWWPAYGGDQAGSFISVNLGGSAYHDVMGDGGLVFAGRLDLGAVLAAAAHDVPPHRRLYAGGSSSVRGYGTQLAGPRDSHGDPTGGLGLIDGGVEARVMVTDTIGVVPFIDAAMVAQDGLAEFNDGIRAGAGIGLRYHTDFGPLRADLAMPFRRERDDDMVQFYISFGQAF